MIVYRCTLERHISNTLSGDGAAQYGGRWNSKGVPVIYSAESRIMAVLELVIRQPIDKICSEYRILPIEAPEDMMTVPKLPAHWKEDERVTRKIGDDLLRKGDHLLIKVPSALISNSYNYLINPFSIEIQKVRLMEPETILMDSRLLEALRK
jgi:RES domain-containing protein